MLAGCCYGRRPRPDQGLIHRPTKTEVTAVVTRRVAPISAAVARTNWRSLRPTTCPYVNDTPRRKPCGFVLSGESVIGASPSPVASPGPRQLAGRGIILHLGAVGYRLLRKIFTSNDVALEINHQHLLASPWSKGCWWQVPARRFMPAGRGAHAVLEPGCSVPQ